MDTCKKCGNSENFNIQYGPTHTGLYCSKCDSWVKWIGKKELPLYEKMVKSRKNISARENFVKNLKSSISVLGLSKEDLLSIINEIYK